MADEILEGEMPIETATAPAEPVGRPEAVAAPTSDATPTSPVPMDTVPADMPLEAPEAPGGGVDSGAVPVTAPEGAPAGAEARIQNLEFSGNGEENRKQKLEISEQNAGAGWRGVLARGLEAIRFRKRGKLEKIMTLVAANGSVTNDQVEKLLQASDATASRYLAQLVAAGRLRRIGRDGGAKYETNNGSNRTI